MESSPALEGLIDPAFPPETSIVARYRNAFTTGDSAADARFRDLLLETSLREGARVFPLLRYRGVAISVLDESSLMQTGTLKSIDGCFTLAQCKQRGYERVVFESGGNTGMALTEYGRHAGLETFLFVPEDNLSLLDSRAFEAQRSHLIAVADRGGVKQAARSIVGLDGIHHIPQVSWRYQGAMFRGLFILEHILAQGTYDWLTQTISAAFGPIGIYRVLHERLPGAIAAPRFLGFQQEANCPMYSAWRAADPQGQGGSSAGRVGGELLTKIMYDDSPQTYGTYEDLERVLVATRGDLKTVNHAQFAAALARRFDGKGILEWLGENDFHVHVRSDEIVDKTGLISLAGTLAAIDEGTIAEGSRVLCCLTSGTGRADGAAEPELRLSEDEDLETSCRSRLGLSGA